MARRKWLPIVVGIVIFIVIVGVGVVGTGIYILSRQVAVTAVETDDPEAAFEEVRAKFAGRRPYIEFAEADLEATAVVHRELERDGQPPLENLHVIAWEDRDRRLVRLALPFWIVRLGGSGDLSLSESQSGVAGGVKLHITAADLERFGPGLILDVRTRRGQQIIIWAD